MTDERAEDRIDIIERWLAATDQCIPVFALRWLLGEYRQQVEELADKRVAEIGRAADNARDAARFRHCERAAEPSDSNDDPWWVLTVRGPTFAEAVDAAREQAGNVTTD